MREKQFSIRMPAELWDRIQKDATDSDRSVGAQIRRILRLWYEEKDKGHSQDRLG